jgi:hypothetical protein
MPAPVSDTESAPNLAMTIFLPGLDRSSVCSEGQQCVRLSPPSDQQGRHPPFGLCDEHFQ